MRLNGRDLGAVQPFHAMQTRPLFAADHCANEAMNTRSDYLPGGRHPLTVTADQVAL